MPNTTTDGVSVIIAAHNEEENLQKFIPLLLNQNYPQFEVIVVNDRSQDRTLDYLNTIHSDKFKVVSVKEIPIGLNPKKHALATAIKEAKYDILLLTDADCYPSSENWISRMTQNLKREIVLGYSPYEKRKGFLNLFIRFETLLTAMQYLSFSLRGLTYMGVGRNLGYKKDVFVKNNGFGPHGNVMGGDDDLFIGSASNSSNTSICIEKDGEMISIPKTDWKSFFKQKLRHLSVGKLYTWKMKVVSALLPLSQIVFYLTCLLLIMSDMDIYSILGPFILRTLILIIIFVLITRKLGDRIKWFWIPALDLCYTVYFIILGITTIFYKRVQWK